MSQIKIIENIMEGVLKSNIPVSILLNALANVLNHNEEYWSYDSVEVENFIASLRVAAASANELQG